MTRCVAMHSESPDRVDVMHSAAQRQYPERVLPLRRPEGHSPPIPRYSADLQPGKKIAVLFVGVQGRSIEVVRQANLSELCNNSEPQLTAPDYLGHLEKSLSPTPHESDSMTARGMGGWSERVMGQKGFFDVERRLEAISAKGDPLETIKKMVRWEDFRADIEAVTERRPEERQSNAGRKPYDTILKFKIVVLQSLHNLSDEQTEYLIRDRLSFMRFLDLELEDPVPDATTIWLFREALAQAGLIDKLFERFGQHLEAEGYIARGGQIIDATIVSVPKQRNTKEENEAIKAGKTPEGWEQQPAKNAQKDKDARWTKKNDTSFYGYKNHLGVDKAHKLIRKWDATDAAVHDSQKLDDVLDLSNTGKGVWADSAYRSVQIEAGLKAKGLQSRIHRRAARNRPLSERQKSANTTRSRVRARVEHVFGHQQNSMGGKIVRTIGIARARFKIGMMNLGYNIRRLVQLERLAAVPA